MKKHQHLYEKAIIKRVIDKCEFEETKDQIKQFFIEIQEQEKDFQSPARSLVQISKNNPEHLWISLLYDYINLIQVDSSIFVSSLLKLL